MAFSIGGDVVASTWLHESRKERLARQIKDDRSKSQITVDGERFCFLCCGSFELAGGRRQNRPSNV